MIDVIDSGFDAGIRYGGTVPEDMIAQRLAPDFRWVVVAHRPISNALGRRRTRASCRTIVACASGSAMRASIGREFERGKNRSQRNVPGSLLIDQGHVALPAVKQGSALMYVPDFVAAQFVRDGVR